MGMDQLKNVRYLNFDQLVFERLESYLYIHYISLTHLRGTGSQLANLQANCRLQKLKMLLQGNSNEQVNIRARR